jgi:hypothetical protein
MKTLRVRVVCAALTLLVGTPARVQTGHDLLQQALVMEQAEGNLQEGCDPERLWETDVGILSFPLSPDHRRVGILDLTMGGEIWVMENLAAVLRESRVGG